MRKIASLAGLIIGLSSPMIVFAAEVTVTPSDAIARQVHTRSLAASCAACHGTGGNSSGATPSISNIYKPTFISQMLAFKSGERQATVMHRHAKGLTNQEIEDLAEYFSNQPRQNIRTIPTQSLSKNYPN